MNTADKKNSFPQLLDYARLQAELDAGGGACYEAASPFPHAVFEDFLPAKLLDAVLNDFPAFPPRIKQEDASEVLDDGTVAQYRKNWLSMEMRVTPLIRRLYWELNSADFVGWLEQLTGIDGLIPDPYFAGAGLHETHRGGHLMVHADYNKHPELNLDRRLNLIIYLNRDWEEEYGGHLELWDRALTQCEKKVAPIAGRAVIFSTLRDSWHGHPHPLACPEHMSRKSIALYYYTNGRPVQEGNEAHLTLWQKVPEDKQS
jgi:hypothetical protein